MLVPDPRRRQPRLDPSPTPLGGRDDMSFQGGSVASSTAGDAEGSAKAPASARRPFAPLVTVVGFHHARGPEVESWYGVPEGSDPAVEYDWNLLPFMALSDGAHA